MRNYLIAFILLILCASSGTAITASILTGMIQVNVDKAPSTFQKSIGVKNENNVTVDISFSPSDDIKSMVSMETYNLSLAPGEQRFVKFNLTVPELKEYRSNIKIIFSVPGSNKSDIKSVV